MNKDDLTLLFAYNRWANARVLAACRKATPEQLTAPAAVSFGSVLGVLQHILGAEIIWRMRLQDGISPARRPESDEFPTFDQLAARWQQEEAAMLAWIETLDEEDLNRWVEFRTTNGQPQGATLWKALSQVILHGAQFRGEAGAALAALGCSPGDLDFILYLRETNQR